MSWNCVVELMERFVRHTLVYATVTMVKVVEFAELVMDFVEHRRGIRGMGRAIRDVCVRTGMRRMVKVVEFME